MISSGFLKVTSKQELYFVINYWQLKACLGNCHHMFALFLYFSLVICFYPLSAEHNTRWIFGLFLCSLLMFEGSMKKATYKTKSHLPNVSHLIGILCLRFSDSLLINWFTFKTRVQLTALFKLTHKWPSYVFNGNFLIFLKYISKLCLSLLTQMFNKGWKKKTLAHNFTL